MPELRTIPIDKIRIPDVRVSSILNEEQKAFLSSTIREIGVIQDPVVRDLGDGTYELISGNSVGLPCLSGGVGAAGGGPAWLRSDPLSRII